MSALIVDAATARANDRPGDQAVADASRTWSNAELDHAVGAVVMGAHRVGIGRGSMVAALLDDGAPTIALFHAARRLGAVLVPLNRRAALPELRQRLALVDATALVYDGAHATRAVELSNTGMPAIAVADLLATLADSPPPVQALDPSSPALVLFTSGTGGQPKAAVLTHANLAASADAWAGQLQPLPSDLWLACLPLFHIAGLAIVARTDRWGLPLLIQSEFAAAAVDAAIDQGISHVSLVPQMLARLLEHRGHRAVPASLRAVLIGGGPVDVPLLVRARAVGIEVVVTYGMTETASGIASGTLESGADQRLPLLHALTGVSLSIDRSSSDASAVGEIVVRGAMVSPGYVEDGRLPDSAQDAREAPAFSTGDFGALDADGGLSVADRRDDLIISGGENVYPAEIETILRGHVSVADAAVIGRVDQRWGEVPVAVITAAHDHEPDAAAIVEYCRERVAAFKVPVEIEVVAELPRTRDGKLRRREIRERYEPRP
jgi:O-succinylbenzoic acid--CoA ligase